MSSRVSCPIFAILLLALPSHQEKGVHEIVSLRHKIHFHISDCAGPLKPEVVDSTEHATGRFPASNVLILGEEDAQWRNRTSNYWLAEVRKTTDQGFTMKVDNCKRLLTGCQVKNKGKGQTPDWSTKEFKVSGAKNANGPWETLLQEELVDTTGGKSASLLNFTFDKPVEVQYLRFDLVNYWGTLGGGLQYFAPIPATSKKD